MVPPRSPARGRSKLEMQNRIPSAPMLKRRALLAGLTGLPLLGAAAPAAKAALTDPTLVETLKTEFNHIVVRRYGPQVSMNFIVNRCEFVESVYEPSDPGLLAVEYTRYITAALAYAPALRSILEIGLGGGRTVNYLNRHLPRTLITGVEIDAGVVALAKKHFGLRESKTLKLVVDDGRRHLMTSPAKHDVILVDAYRGTWVPETLTSVEFFELVRSRLNSGGVVAQNVEPSTLFEDGMAATLRHVFGNVDRLPAAGNIVMVAYEGKPKTQRELMQRAEGLQRQFRFRHPLPRLLAVRQPITEKVATPPMRDGSNEANTLLLIDKANAKDTPRQRKARCE